MKKFAYWCGKLAYDNQDEATQEAKTWSEPERQMIAYPCRMQRCQELGFWHLRTETKRRRREGRIKRLRKSAPHQAWENEGGASTVRWLASGQTTDV